MYKNKLSIFCPIKINLALHVIETTDNNYHLLESLVVFAKEGDFLTINEATKDNFVINGEFSNQLDTKDNLIIKARDLLRNYINNSYPINIELNKNLPVSSGLGGGSSDAAGTLYLLRKIWQSDISDEKLLELSSQIGADVPCCLYYLLYNKNLYIEGIGNKFTEITKLPPLNMIIVNNHTKISTKEVFNKLANKNNSSLIKLKSFNNFNNLICYLKQTRNDLYQAAKAIEPELSNIQNEIINLGADFATMSGSGASTIGLFDSYEKAYKAAISLKDHHSNWYIKALQI